MPRKKSTRRKSSAGKSKNSIKIGGKTFVKVACRGAKTEAKKLREKGYTARVIGGCVYKGPKSKTKRKRA